VVCSDQVADRESDTDGGRVSNVSTGGREDGCCVRDFCKVEESDDFDIEAGSEGARTCGRGEAASVGGLEELFEVKRLVLLSFGGSGGVFVFELEGTVGGEGEGDDRRRRLRGFPVPGTGFSNQHMLLQSEVSDAERVEANALSCRITLSLGDKWLHTLLMRKRLHGDARGAEEPMNK
jgi:hypothetical protein